MENEYVSPLMGRAVEYHEIYTSMVDAGFNPDQAMYLLGKMIGAMIEASMRS